MKKLDFGRVFPGNPANAAYSGGHCATFISSQNPYDTPPSYSISTLQLIQLILGLVCTDGPEEAHEKHLIKIWEDGLGRE